MKIKILLVLFLLALFLRIISLFTSLVKWWDETVYANLGFDLVSNPFDYSFAKKWSDYTKDWPKAGCRPPLLPYSLALIYALTNSQVLVDLFMPVIGSFSVVILYLLAENLFNHKVALYSSLFLSFLPLHVFYSSKIMTDVYAVFFLLISALFFWSGFEKGKKKHKLIFGFFLGLALLARFTTVLILPLFPAFLLLRHKNFSFLKDRFLWYSLGIFLITLTPWFVYGIFEYKNPIGPFVHAEAAAKYWGGEQAWYFFFQHSLEIFSVLSFTFLFSLAFILKERVKDRNIIFLVLWFSIFFVLSIFLPHKEDRYFLPVVPPVAILSAFFISQVKYSKLFFIVVILLLLLDLVDFLQKNFLSSHNLTNYCFLEANNYISSLEKDALIITDQSPLVYFYTKKETHFYPSPFTLYTLEELITKHYQNRSVYVFFNEFENPEFKSTLDLNFEIIYQCNNKSIVYRYS